MLLATIVRLTAGFISVLAGIAACVLVLAATGGPNPAGTVLAFALLIPGFVGLAVTRTPAAPWRPTRIALAIALVLIVALLSSLPWPPAAGGERQSAIILSLALVLTLLALLFASRAPRVALVLLAILAVYGCFMIVSFTRAVARATTGTAYAGPAVVISVTLAACIGAAWIGALWLSRGALRASSEVRAASPSE